MSELRVRDLMTDDPFSLETDATLYDLRESLAEKSIRHVPIVGEEGELVGLISERDMLRMAIAPASELPVSMQADAMRASTVSDIMTREVETVGPDDSISLAAQLMLDNKYGCLPVVDGDRLVGILTESDFVRYLAG